MNAFTSGAPRASSGFVYGRAGGGLKKAEWAASSGAAKAGQRGERKTATVLDPFASPNAIIFHDLMIPASGYTANIDHAIVAGNKVHLLDSKVWKPGFMWTLGGKTRRGFDHVPHAGSKTMAMARDAITAYLAGAGAKAALVDATVVVWPSSRDGQVSTWAMRMDGAKVIPSANLEAWARRHTSGRTEANDAIVSAMYELLVDTGSGKPGSQAAKYRRR